MAVEHAQERTRPFEQQREDDERNSQAQAVGHHQTKALGGRAGRHRRAEYRAKRDADAWSPAGGESHPEHETARGATSRRGAVHHAVLAIEQRDADEPGDVRRHHEHQHARDHRHVDAHRLHGEREQIEEEDEDQGKARHESETCGGHGQGVRPLGHLLGARGGHGDGPAGPCPEIGEIGGDEREDARGDERDQPSENRERGADRVEAGH